MLIKRKRGAALTGALERFINKLAFQKPEYLNARQEAELHKLIIETGRLYTRCGGMGYNPDAGALRSVAARWDELKPGCAMFAGPAELTRQSRGESLPPVYVDTSLSIMYS